MKNLFFVSVAVGIFSGTSISATAQTSVNSVKFAATPKKSVQFIEGIEIKRDAAVAAETDLWTTKPVNKPVPLPVIKVTYAKAAVNNNSVVIENCSALQFKYAQLMDIDVELITNTKLYEAIEGWWATRYRYGGTTKSGIDCSAFTGTVIKESLEIVLPRTARAQYANTERVAKEDLQEGDLVFFNTRGGVSHVGIYLNNGYFTHSSTHAGVTISSLNDSYYGKKYIGGGRIINNQQ